MFFFENSMKLTVRIAVVLFGCDTVKSGRRFRTSRCLHGAWTYVKSVQQKSSGLIFHKSRSGSDVR